MIRLRPEFSVFLSSFDLARGASTSLCEVCPGPKQSEHTRRVVAPPKCSVQIEESMLANVVVPVPCGDVSCLCLPEMNIIIQPWGSFIILL